MAGKTAAQADIWGDDDDDDTAIQLDGALAIRACLENLRKEARELGFNDLARFIGLAAAAAEQAAEELGAETHHPPLRYSDAVGSC